MRFLRGHIDCQERVGAAYRDQERWTRTSILKRRPHREILIGPLDPGVLREDLGVKPVPIELP